MKGESQSEKPYIGPETSWPEITIKAFILGAVLSAVMAGANAYLGLKVGMTVSASIPAAVISMAVLRLFRKSNILENNIVQTAASAGESLAAGVIFTLPALILMRYWTTFNYLETMVIAAVGGVIGVLFTIPLRRALIIEANLKFPEGVATAEVLKAGSQGGEGIGFIIKAGLASSFLKLAQSGFKILAGSSGGSITIGRSIFGFGSEFSVALLGVGYIVGINIAVLVFCGGLISWLFGIPVYTARHGGPEGLEGYDAALQIWSTKIRYMGVGAMIVGGLWAVLSLLKPIRDGVRSSMDALRKARSGKGEGILRTEKDIPIHIVLASLAISAVPVFLVSWLVIDQASLHLETGGYALIILFAVVFSLVAGFLFSSVAGYMAGLVGSSNNPISGVTIATVLSASLSLLVLIGIQYESQMEAVLTDMSVTGAAAAILIGAIVCCAAAIAGDNMQDLKAGRIVGATPWKQQIMQIVGVLAAALVLPPILAVLFNAYGLGGVFPREGMDPAEMLSAPQATLMQSVAQGVFERNLEWPIIFIGCGIGIAIIIIDQVLKAKKTKFRAPVLAVAVGIYLPLELTVPIFVGGLIAWWARRRLNRRKDELGDGLEAALARSEQRGLLSASGLITGEALMGIVLAIPFAIAQDTDVLRLMPAGWTILPTVLSIILMLVFILWLASIVKRTE